MAKGNRIYVTFTFTSWGGGGGGLPWAAVDSLGLTVHRPRVPELCLIEKYVLRSKRRINK